MKRFFLLTAVTFMFVSFGFTNQLNNVYADDDFEPIKAIFIDVGGGGNGMSAALGFRYSFASLSVGLAGFTNKIPNYALTPPTGVYFNPTQPLPSGYTEDKHLGLIVSFDAGFHLDYFYPYTFFATVGYFTQQDSVLAKEVRIDGRSPNRYAYRVENTDGFAFGGGGNYQISDYVALGLGLHTKRGIYGQFVYTW